MLEQILSTLHGHVNLAPFVVFGLLIMAGFFFPVSEDALVVFSALMAAAHPDKIVSLFIGVFLGSYISDLTIYSWGRHVGPRIWRMKFFSKIISHDKVDHIAVFYKKYGIITLIVGRFIPFGVRSALFISAGLGKMDFKKFALSDLLACTLSNVVLFGLTYFYGDVVIQWAKKSSLAIFIVAFLFILVIIWQLLRKRASRK